VALLKGVPADVFEKLKSIVTISPGARELCRCLKVLGYKMAVLSGGFQPLAEWLAGELGIDYAFANHVRYIPSIMYIPIPNAKFFLKKQNSLKSTKQPKP
jgi:phosphoserine phosphatase